MARETAFRKHGVIAGQHETVRRSVVPNFTWDWLVWLCVVELPGGWLRIGGVLELTRVVIYLTSTTWDVRKNRVESIYKAVTQQWTWNLTRIGMRDNRAGVGSVGRKKIQVGSENGEAGVLEEVSSEVRRWHSSIESRIWDMIGLRWLVTTRPCVWPWQWGAVVEGSSNYVSPKFILFFQEEGSDGI